MSFSRWWGSEWSAKLDRLHALTPKWSFLMANQSDLARAFAALHVPGAPVILFNVWDAGTAKAVAQAGAKAIATGSASVAGSLGLSDGESVPFDLVLANAARIVASVDQPVSLDFEGGYAIEPAQLSDNFAAVVATGIVGCNFEDQVVGTSGLYSIEEQAARIAALRTASNDVPAFINARTDLFLKAPSGDHNAALIDAALERATAYRDAGSDGLFVPGLIDDALIADLCAKSPLPVNVMVMGTISPNHRLAELGVARISYGPGPWRRSMTALSESAKAVLA
jgi:2-methylisocitrate lyase-like PEP mutase family enzyme